MADAVSLARGPNSRGAAILGPAVWPILGLAVMAAPTVYDLFQREWSKESGMHGPFLLAIGGWLVWRKLNERDASSPRGAAIGVIALLALSLPVYVFGAAYDFLTLQVAGLFGTFVAMIYGQYGLKTLKSLAFPLLFLALAVPAPHLLIDAVTGSLKQFVSQSATSGLSALGVPVAREGVTIFVAQYQLLVEDACSGLNSLQGLITMGLLYAYLMHGSSFVHSALLTALSVPIAIAANIVRVGLLVVTTYVFGTGVSEGVFHMTAGLVVYAVALMLLLATDGVLGLIPSLRRR